MKKNKKAALSETDKILFWFIFVIPACGLMVALIFIAMPKLIAAQTTISQDLQQQIYVSMITGSPLCFAYEDVTANRVYNGYIDLKKVTSNQLDDCLKLEKINELGIFVSIYKEGSFVKEVETKNALKRVSSRSIEIEKPIILIDENKEYNGIIKFIFY